MLECRLAVGTKKGNAPFCVPRCKDNEFSRRMQIRVERSLQLQRLLLSLHAMYVGKVV